MAEFGWAYISGAITGKGDANAVQFIKTANGELTGSEKFTFDSSSDVLTLTGSMKISGTLEAHTFDVIHTNKIELSSSGATNFGDDSGDNHVFTGSVSIVSGGFRQHYYQLTATTYTVQSYDSIIGVTNTNSVTIQLPKAVDAGAGKILIIKDETTSTRSDANKIIVSASFAFSESIDRETAYELTGDNPALTLYSNGVDNWFIY